MRRRGPFALVAFDVLVLNGKDVRALPLVERKKLLRAVVPRRSSTVLYAQHVNGRGRDLFAEVCRQDLEGIVAKHHAGRYGEDEPTRWLKIKNPECSQARCRAEMVER
jgi:bifunctional non-homologous end joining protein LigD